MRARRGVFWVNISCGLQFGEADAYAHENAWLHNFGRTNGVRGRDDVPQMPVPVPDVTAAFHF